MGELQVDQLRRYVEIKQSDMPSAVAAKKTNKPVRIWMPLEDNMKMLGMRNHYLFDYKVITNTLVIVT